MIADTGFLFYFRMQMPYSWLPVSDFTFDFFFDWWNDESQEISNNVLHLFDTQFLFALSVQQLYISAESRIFSE